jgi:hypothetical protein
MFTRGFKQHAKLESTLLHRSLHIYGSNALVHAVGETHLGNADPVVIRLSKGEISDTNSSTFLLRMKCRFFKI